MTIREPFDWMQYEVHQCALDHGWWQHERSFLEVSALIMSELGEAIEAIRDPGISSKILGFSNLEEELADTVIRILDAAQYYKLKIGDRLESRFANDPHLEFAQLDKNASESDAFVHQMRNVGFIYETTQSLRISQIEYISIVMMHIGSAIRDFLIGSAEGDATYFLALACAEIAAVGYTFDLNIGDAILAKHQYNKSRSYRHGGKLY